GLTQLRRAVSLQPLADLPADQDQQALEPLVEVALLRTDQLDGAQGAARTLDGEHEAAPGRAGLVGAGSPLADASQFFAVELPEPCRIEPERRADGLEDQRHRLGDQVAADQRVSDLPLEVEPQALPLAVR